MPVRQLMVIGLVCLAGCDAAPPPSKARPIEEARAAEAIPEIDAPKPEKSEPEAAQIVNTVLLAHTNNEPSLIEKFRKVQIKRKGVFQLPDRQSNMTMEIQMWGDQYRAKMTFDSLPTQFSIYWVSGNAGWMLPPMAEQRVPLDLAQRENVFPDVRGDQMTVLTPLLSDKLVCTLARPQSEGNNPFVRVWIPDQPPILIEVDAKTNHISRLIYQAMDSGRKVERTLRLSDYKAVAGVMLPHKVVFGIGERPLTTWSSIHYEVPGVFDLSIFDKP